MHVQSCCFGCKTYCFYDVFVAVRVVGSQVPTLCGLPREPRFQGAEQEEEIP